jgi:hypothetical protein
MMNYETPPRGAKAPVRSCSNHEREDDLHDLITHEIAQAAKRLEPKAMDQNYDVDCDLNDLELAGQQFLKSRTFTRGLQYKAFEYLMMTPIRAKANKATRRLLSRLRRQLEIDERKSQTIYHLLARGYLGFTNAATISMWARAAEYAVAHLRTDETVPAFLKRMGGIRACANAAREEGNEEGDDREQEESVSPKKPKPKLDPSARARMQREAAEDHCDDRRASRSMAAGSGTGKRKQEVASAADYLDKEHFEDDDDERPPQVDFSEDAREAFEAGSDDEEGVAHVIRRGDVIEVKCIVWTEDAEDIIDQAR